jgi:hypothetical protein
MSRINWRFPDAYEDLRSLDAAGFAWEYLRRNPEFLRDQSRLERAAADGAPDPDEMEAFAHRWGVRFCKSEPDGKPWLCAMVAKYFAKRRDSNTASCGSRRS